MKGIGRTFAVALVVALAWGMGPTKGATARPFIIALISLTEVDNQTFDGFRAGMAEHGYRVGETVEYVDLGPAGYGDAVAPIVRAHLALGIDLLVTASTPVTRIAAPLAREKNVPVVFAPVNDPVAAGIVPNLRHPGGNVTGIRLPAGDDLRMQYLTLVAPMAKRVLLPFNPDDASSQRSADMAQTAAGQMGVTIDARPVRSTGDILALFANLPADIDAVFLPRDSMIEAQMPTLAEAMRELRLPVSAPGIAQVHQGALLSYGFVHAEIGRRAARLADRILHGIPAGDLPIESAENHLAINLATARAIGLRIPSDILAQADAVIGQ